MYAKKFAEQNPDSAAIIMASTGVTVTYAEFEARCNQLAHLLRSNGLERGDHYAIFMENHERYVETCGAGERAGLYYTPINSFLKADELAYIVNNCEAKVLITSAAKVDVAREALASCPNVTLALIVDTEGDDTFKDYRALTAELPTTPINDESLGAVMPYSSGTTGNPKGILRPLQDVTPDVEMPFVKMSMMMWMYREAQTYLSPAPLYHAAPQGAVGNTIRLGGTAVIMEKFDAEQCLNLIKKYKVTHIQMVPTMFGRLLKLPEDIKAQADVSSLESVVHAAAPCPVPVKEQMIDWWGPIIYEYYSSSEGHGFAACNSEEWLAHKGTVGRVVAGVLHVLDDEGNEVPTGTSGELWFEKANEFEYFNNKEKTEESSSADGSMATVGDVGYVDEEGFLYLTDRSTFMIISGGVNIYPQETENLLVTHPKVADAAVIGVPNEDFGEEVKAVIEPMPGVAADAEFEVELIAFCEQSLSKIKCPKSVDFTDALPRLPTGKLYKKQLRDSYWGDSKNRLLK